MSCYGIKSQARQPDPVTIERMAAADLLLVARRALLERPRLGAGEREHYAKRFEDVAQELIKAAAEMRKGAPESFTPDYLRADTAARFHD